MADKAIEVDDAPVTGEQVVAHSAGTPNPALTVLHKQFVWYVGAVAHQLSHGMNPLFSNAIFVPTGVNIAQNFSAPLLGALVTPITLAFGPVISANLLLLLAMPASASAAPKVSSAPALFV